MVQHPAGAFEPAGENARLGVLGDIATLAKGGVSEANIQWVSLTAMAGGQALQPCGLTGGLTTGSRLRRTRTPIWMKELKKAKGTADKTVYDSCARSSAFNLSGFHLSFEEICSNKPSNFCSALISRPTSWTCATPFQARTLATCASRWVLITAMQRRGL